MPDKLSFSLSELDLGVPENRKNNNLSDQFESSLKLDPEVRRAERDKELEEITAKNKGAKLLVDASNDMGNVDLERVKRVLNERDKIARDAELVAENNPTLMGQLKNVKDKAFSVGAKGLDFLVRYMNVATTREAGTAAGLIKSLRGESTFAETYNSYVKNTKTWPDVLREFESLRKVDEVEDKAGKTALGKLAGFGIVPSFTTRIGLAMDIVLDPLTYISLGSNVPAKIAAKTSTKSIFVKEGVQGAKSIARFGKYDLLTDKEFMQGVTALRSTKAGRAIENSLDMFSASVLGKVTRGIIEPVGSWFNSGNKQADRLLRRQALKFQTGKKGLHEFADKVFDGMTQEQRIAHGKALFDAMERERPIREALKARGLKGEELLKEFAKIPRTAFKDEVITKVDSEMLKVLTDLADRAGIPKEIQFSNYFHSSFDEQVKAGLRKSKTRFDVSKKATTNAAKFKQFKREGVIFDSKEMFLKIADDLNRLATVNDTIKLVTRAYGKSFDSVRAAREAGFREYFSSDTLRFFKKGIQTEAGEQTITALGRKANPTFLPEEVVKSLEQFGETNKMVTNQIMRLYDGFTTQFKVWSLSVWPAYTALNIKANFVQRFLSQGAKAFSFADNGDAIRMLHDTAKTGGKITKKLAENGKHVRGVFDEFVKTVDGRTVSKTQIFNQAKKRGVVENTSVWGDVDVAGMLTKGASKSDPIFKKFISQLDGRTNKIAEIGREVNLAVESQARLASFITAVKDGFSFDEASQIVFNGLFDYTALTKADKLAFKRIFPFWTFQKKNLALQTSALLRTPGRQASVLKIVKDLEDDALKNLSDEDLAIINDIMPTFLESTFTIPAGVEKTEDGDKIMFISGLGLPQQEIFNLFEPSSVAFSLNPLIKATTPIDNFFNGFRQNGAVTIKPEYNFKELELLFKFFYKDHEAQSRVRDFINDPKTQETNPIVRLLKLKVVETAKFDSSNRKTNETKFRFEADPTMIEIIRNLQFARFISTARQLGNENVDAGQFMTNFLTGYSIFKIDVEKSAHYRKLEALRNSRAGLKRGGVHGGYSFEIDAAGDEADGSTKRLVRRMRKR